MLSPCLQTRFARRRPRTLATLADNMLQEREITLDHSVLRRVEIKRDNRVVRVDTLSIADTDSHAEILAGLKAMRESDQERQLRIDLIRLARPDGACAAVCEFFSHGGIETVMLERSRRDVPEVPLMAVAGALVRGKGLEWLVLERCHGNECAAALGTLLVGSTSLTRLTLRAMKNDCDSDRLETLASACRANRIVQELHVDGCHAPRLSNGFMQHLGATVTRLRLDGRCDMRALPTLLQHSQCLQELQLLETHLGKEDCESLIQALRVNPSLCKLHLGDKVFAHSTRTQRVLDQMDQMIRAAAAGSLQEVHLSCLRFGHGHWTRQWTRLFRTLFARGTNLLRVELRAITTPHLYSLATCLSACDPTLTELQLVLDNDVDAKALLYFCQHGLVRNGSLQSLQVVGSKKRPTQLLPYHVMVPVFESLSHNLTLTDIRFSHLAKRPQTAQCRKEESKKHLLVIMRNRTLARLGANAPSKLWPRLMELCLETNLWVGTSLVFDMVKQWSKQIGASDDF